MRFFKLFAVLATILGSAQQPTISSEEQNFVGVNTVGIMTTGWIENDRSAWKDHFAEGEKAQQANRLDEAENAYLASIKDALALSPYNQLAVQSLDKLSEVYSAKGEVENSKVCQLRSAETSEYLLHGVLKKPKTPDVPQPPAGKITTLLDKFESENRTKTSKWAVWKRMNNRALREVDPTKAAKLFFDAAGYAGARLQPALNVERETSLVDWAEFDLRHNLPDGEFLVKSAEANASFNLPPSDPLRQRIGRLQAELASRQKQPSDQTIKAK